MGDSLADHCLSVDGAGFGKQRLDRPVEKPLAIGSLGQQGTDLALQHFIGRARASQKRVTLLGRAPSAVTTSRRGASSARSKVPVLTLRVPPGSLLSDGGSNRTSRRDTDHTVPALTGCTASI